jgi:peptidoglycan/xylan/chitin deacetylase (PgdA/CDA1 family)
VGKENAQAAPAETRQTVFGQVTVPRDSFPRRCVSAAKALLPVPLKRWVREELRRSKQSARQFRNRFAHAPLILLYHRVAELESDPQLLSVTQSHFAEHLHILGQHARPMKLREMVRALRENNLPRRAVAVTLDDGYADNLYNGKPLLERYNIPATVYVSSGYVDTSREFVHDTLERLFLRPGRLPQQLALTIRGRTHQWDLEGEAYYSEEAYQRNRAWHVLKAETPTPRQHVYRSLCQLVYTLSDGERQSALEALMLWAGTTSVCRPTYRVLGAGEIRILAEGGLVDVGSHTVAHPVLSALPVVDQRDEVQRSKACLEEILGRPVTSFAYPYGGRSDYTAETVAIVREVGYDHACSNFEGLVGRGTDPWQLPRFLVRDWDGDKFARLLREWQRM